MAICQKQGTLSVKKPNTIPYLIIGEWNTSRYEANSVDDIIAKKARKGSLINHQVIFLENGTYYEISSTDTIWGNFRMNDKKRLLLTNRKSSMAIYANLEFNTTFVGSDSLILDAGDMSDIKIVLVRGTPKAIH